MKEVLKEISFEVEHTLKVLKNVMRYFILKFRIHVGYVYFQILGELIV